MKTSEQRIKNIIGQLQGVEKMIQENKNDCLRIMVQLKAVKSAVGSLMEKYMESEFDSCLLQSKGGDKEQIKKIFSEMVRR